MPSQLYTRKSITLLHACLACALSGAANGAEWSAKPSVEASVSNDDNIFLSDIAPISTRGVSVAPEVNLSWRTASSTINFGGRLEFYRYTASEITDSNVSMLTLSGNTTAKRSKLSWNGFYKSDSTTTTITEVTNTGAEGDDGEPGDLDGGVVDVNLVEVVVRRNQFRLLPTWSYALTQSTAMRLGYRINDVRYSGEENSGLTDFWTQGVDASLSYRMSRRDTVDTGVSASRYEATDTNTTADNYSITLTLRHEFSPLLQGTITGGYRSTALLSGDTTGGVLNAGLVSRARSTSYRLNLLRDVYPSGTSDVLLSDQLRATVNHQISPVLSFYFNGLAFRNKSLDPAQTFSNRTYYSIDFGVQRSITRFWSIDGSYIYRWQEFDDAGKAGDSNAIYLSVNYAWQGITASR